MKSLLTTVLIVSAHFLLVKRRIFNGQNLLCLLIFSSILTFISCSKNSSTSVQPKPYSQLILGQWNFDSVRQTWSSNGFQILDTVYDLKYNFKSNNEVDHLKGGVVTYTENYKIDQDTLRLCAGCSNDEDLIRYGVKWKIFKLDDKSMVLTFKNNDYLEFDYFSKQ